MRGEVVEVGSAPTKAYTPVTSCGQYATSSPFALMVPPPVPQLPLKPVPLLKAGEGSNQTAGPRFVQRTKSGDVMWHQPNSPPPPPPKCMRERMRSCVCMSACAYVCANECGLYAEFCKRRWARYVYLYVYLYVTTSGGNYNMRRLQCLEVIKRRKVCAHLPLTREFHVVGQQSGKTCHRPCASWNGAAGSCTCPAVATPAAYPVGWYVGRQYESKVAFGAIVGMKGWSGKTETHMLGPTFFTYAAWISMPPALLTCVSPPTSSPPFPVCGGVVVAVVADKNLYAWLSARGVDLQIISCKCPTAASKSMQPPPAAAVRNIVALASSAAGCAIQFTKVGSISSLLL
jgi:hypothetical protein